MNAEAIRDVRRFNRTVGERLGFVRDRFLGRPRPPGESRILWEIGTEGVDVRTLRRRLALDSGYVSRVLQSLARQGLVRISIDQSDRRVRRARLTTKGLAERAELDRRSDLLAAGILDPLSTRQRETLVDAMRNVERLLTASMVRFAVVDPDCSEARWCLRQYFDELSGRFSRGFDPGRSLSATNEELRPPAGLFVVGYSRGTPIGCGALKFHRHAPTELKRMWIDPNARGLGLGARLLGELERYARGAGARVVRLETNRALHEAIALYRACGYREVERFNDEAYAHHWFEKNLGAPARTV